jgi:DNA-binding PadR family transcriptional regulator
MPPSDRRLPAPPPLPLPVAEFHILIAIADGARHGYGIMSDIEERTEGAVRLGPGTLYTALRRMTDRGLVEEGVTGSREDPRRVNYRITAAGREAALAEARRMTACLALVRNTRLASRLEPA